MIVTLGWQRLRRDWWQLLLWVLGSAALALAAVNGVTQTFGAESERAGLLLAVMANRVILLFRGLPSGITDPQVAVFLILPLLALLAGFMSIFLAVRHTRTEEDTGRAELVAATTAGRLLPLVSTGLHGVLADLALGGAVALVFGASGYPVAGSLLAGAATAAVGITFLGVGLLAAQVMRTARGANSLAVWTMVVLYLCAGVGNALGTPSDDLHSLRSSALSWVSPFGWAENTRPYANDEVWPLALCLALALVLVAAAVALQARRDLGASLVPVRPGRAEAPASLATPLGLVWRLSRTAVVGWAVGGLLTGLLATALGPIIDTVGADIPAMARVFATLAAGGTMRQGLIVIFFMVAGVLGACAAVQTVVRARQEETHGTAELAMAAPVDRGRWLAAHLVVAGVGVLAVVLAAVLGAALGTVRQTEPGPVLQAALVAAGGQAVAAAVFGVLTAVVFTVAPRWTVPVGWILVLLALCIGLFGALFGLPAWLVQLAPVSNVPTLVGDALDPKGFWWLLGVVVVGTAAAILLARRRELAAG